jgi:hypothetical protein
MPTELAGDYHPLTIRLAPAHRPQPRLEGTCNDVGRGSRARRGPQDWLFR